MRDNLLGRRQLTIKITDFNPVGNFNSVNGGLIR